MAAEEEPSVTVKHSTTRRGLAGFVSEAGLPDARYVSGWAIHGVTIAQVLVTVFLLWVSGFFLTALLSQTTSALTQGFVSLVLVLLLVAMLGVVTYLVRRRLRIRSLLKRGSLNVHSGNSIAARTCYLDLLSYLEVRLQPAPVLFALASIEAMEGSFDNALQLLRKCGSYPPALEMRALLHLHRREFDAAVRVSTMRLKLKRSTPWSYLLVAAAAQAIGRNAEALKFLALGSQTYPKSPTIARSKNYLESGKSLAELVFDAAMPED